MFHLHLIGAIPVGEPWGRKFDDVAFMQQWCRQYRPKVFQYIVRGMYNYGV